LRQFFRQTILLGIPASALAFGGVYPWLYQPLMIAMILAGIAGVWLGRQRGIRGLDRWLQVAFLMTLAAALAQLIPLSRDTLSAVSPQAVKILDELVLGGFDRHPISVSPQRTLLTLSFLAALGMFAAGVARSFDLVGVPALVRIVTVTAAVMAIVGIVQHSQDQSLIYGFWRPRSPGAEIFGPFVNRNHYAGWMLMAVPLIGGYATGLIERSARAHRHGPWRNRVLWLGTPTASEIMLMAFTLGLMILTVAMTTSRSAIGALTVVMAWVIWLLMKRSWTTRLIGFGYVAVVLAGALLSADVDFVLWKFRMLSQTHESYRGMIWDMTLRMARDFPWTGSGLNSFDVTSLFYEPANTVIHVSAAHNDYLQLIAEGGLLVTLPAIVMAVLIAVQVRRSGTGQSNAPDYRLARVGALVGILAIGLQEFAEFSLQVPANSMLFVVLLGLALHPGRGVATEALPSVAALRLVPAGR